MQRFTSDTIPRLQVELAQAFDRLDSPKQPQRIYACPTANLPPAADFKYCLVFDTTAGALKCSDGANWV